MAIPDDLSTWDYKVRHVQTKDGTVDFDAGDFLRGASVLIVAGPRKYSSTMTSSELFPIGLLQTGSISEQKQLEEVFEIGSERRYFITGRTFFQMQAQRIMVNGASLLRALYNEDTHVGQTIPTGNEPGFNQHYLNLASIFFNKPTGLLVVDNDNDDRVVGGAYLEDAYIQSYNRQIAAPQTVIAEQCVIKFDNMVALSASDILPLLV